MKAKPKREYFAAFYQGNRLNFAFALIFTVILSALEMLFSLLLGGIMDVVAAKDTARLVQMLWTLAAFLPLFFCVNLLLSRFKARYIHKGLRQYKAMAFQRISQKSISAFSSENTGRYLSVLTNDANSIEENYLNRSISLVYESLLFLFALSIMLWYHPLLTAAAVVLILLPVLVSLLMGKGLAIRERLVSDRNESFTAQLKDLLGGFSVIKSFKAEPQANELFDSANAILEREKLNKRWYSYLLNAISLISGNVMQFGIFLLAAWLAIRGQISAGTVIIFVNLCNYLIQPIQDIPTYWAGRKAAKKLVEKLAELTEQNSGHGGALIPAKLENAISFEHVSFAYQDGPAVLKDISCRIEAGKSYAIVGASGSGKTTLLNLLLGSWNSYEGMLTVDGRELREINTDSLYELIGQVGQNVFLFDDTIRRNITMFRDFPEEAVQSAIRRSGLETVIAARGEDYRCGENGVKLSGGERQRIAIARMLLRETPVLLADEATSALDAETAARVASAILDLEGLTRIVVTHRLDRSILRRYDQILMLKSGTLCECGGFDELMERKGQFYALYTVANT